MGNNFQPQSIIYIPKLAVSLVKFWVFSNFTDNARRIKFLELHTLISSLK